MGNPNRKIDIFDSTLRDGSQGEGISFSLQDKINIVKALDEFGVDYIEAGNPGSNPKDLMFFEELKSVKLKKSKLCAFGSTRRKDVCVEDDVNVRNILNAETSVCVIFGKAWDFHVQDILKISAEDNLEMVRDTISYLKEQGKEVIFDAEHFFDGHRENKEYAFNVLSAAKKGGADCLCLCDTNGGTTPDEIEEVTKAVCQLFPDTRIAIHCHDDIGCAVANSMAAVRNGASQVQGTFVGFGERCGNADLSTIIPNLMFKYGFECGVVLKDLKSTATYISEVSNIRLKNTAPYVGTSAFAHKGGMHIDAVIKIPRSFEHIDPELVGNRRKFLTSEVSGRGTILPKIREFAPYLQKDSPQTEMIMTILKEHEFNGYQYEAAEASFELLIKKALDLYKPSFNVIFFKTTDDYPSRDGSMQASAMIQLEVQGVTETVASVGNGPVNALDTALRKALCMFYPQIRDMHLSDYKVRVIDSKNNTGARTRVLIESANSRENWTTIGVSNDIIEASFQALVDSFEYILSKEGV